ncbi:MAG: NAD-dependent epimerase, partial [Mycobacterium sp.]|nr:NAD-dependent epimerase [Mycobacterium sp.]
MPAVPGRAVRALLAGDAERALRSYRLLGPVGPPIAYAASK